LFPLKDTELIWIFFYEGNWRFISPHSPKKDMGTLMCQ
jgi:hypothetical protein